MAAHSVPAVCPIEGPPPRKLGTGTPIGRGSQPPPAGANAKATDVIPECDEAVAATMLEAPASMSAWRLSEGACRFHEAGVVIVPGPQEAPSFPTASVAEATEEAGGRDGG